MNITEVKTAIGVSALNLSKSLDQQGNDTGWLTDWIDTTRTRVSIHKDTVAQIKANPAMTNLALQREDKISQESGKAYEFIRIVAFTPTEVVL